jgi:hypothetical protein
MADGETLAFNGPGLKLVSGAITVTGVSVGDSPVLTLVKTAAVRYTPDPTNGIGGYVSNDLSGIEPTEKPYVAGVRSELVGQAFSPQQGGVVPLFEVQVHWAPWKPKAPQTAVLSELTLTYLDAGGAEHSVESPLRVTVSNRKGGCRDWTPSDPSTS